MLEERGKTVMVVMKM